MIRVRNFMTKDVITISKNSSITFAARLMSSKSVSGLVVIDKNRPIGIINLHDIIMGVTLKKTKVIDVMTKNFTIISPIQSLYHITKLLNKTKIKILPVVDDDKLIGLITETDIIEATRDLTKCHQIILEAILAIFGLATAFFLFYFSPLRAVIFK